MNKTITSILLLASFGLYQLVASAETTNTSLNSSRPATELTNIMLEPAAPLDNVSGCTVRSTEKDVFEISGNCNVRCETGLIRYCKINGDGPNKDENGGRCAINEYVGFYTDVIGYCPNHPVTCKTSLTSVTCTQD